MCAGLKNVVQLVELHEEHTHCGLSTPALAVSDKQKEIIIITKYIASGSLFIEASISVLIGGNRPSY